MRAHIGLNAEGKVFIQIIGDSINTKLGNNIVAIEDFDEVTNEPYLAFPLGDYPEILDKLGFNEDIPGEIILIAMQIKSERLDHVYKVIRRLHGEELIHNEAIEEEFRVVPVNGCIHVHGLVPFTATAKAAYRLSTLATEALPLFEICVKTARLHNPENLQEELKSPRIFELFTEQYTQLFPPTDLEVLYQHLLDHVTIRQ